MMSGESMTATNSYWSSLCSHVYLKANNFYRTRDLLVSFLTMHSPAVAAIKWFICEIWRDAKVHSFCLDPDEGSQTHLSWAPYIMKEGICISITKDAGISRGPFGNNSGQGCKSSLVGCLLFIITRLFQPPKAVLMTNILACRTRHLPDVLQFIVMPKTINVRKNLRNCYLVFYSRNDCC